MKIVGSLILFSYEHVEYMDDDVLDLFFMYFHDLMYFLKSLIVE